MQAPLATFRLPRTSGSLSEIEFLEHGLKVVDSWSKTVSFRQTPGGFTPQSALISVDRRLIMGGA